MYVLGLIFYNILSISASTSGNDNCVVCEFTGIAASKSDVIEMISGTVPDPELKTK